MVDTENPKNIAANFIQEIWNEQNFSLLENFLHPAFADHSLPPAFPENKEGLKRWIITTSQSFIHRTFIEEQVTEGNKTILKIKMELKHIGTWRNIEPTGKEISVIGYRYFQFENNKIIAHWGLLDGNAIENLLKQTFNSCKLQN